MSKGGKGGSQPSGQTTTTTNTAPWSVQQPYLENAFQQAQTLFGGGGPQYYPNATYQPANQNQFDALTNLINQGYGIQGQAESVTNANTGLATGGYLNSNPSQSIFGSIAGSNPGLGIQGSETLRDYASGKYLDAGNPYSSGLAQSVLASTVPSIQSQFINGGGLSGPNAAYATSQGATAALAPIAYNQFTQEQQLQQQAANQLGSQSLAGTGLQLQGATGLSDAYKAAIQNMIQGQALFPQTAQSELLGPQTAYSAAAQQQQLSQNAINDALQRWNYQQTLPYQLLNQYIGQVSGNYGGTSQSLNPYYINSGANALSGGLGGALLGSQVLGPAGFGLTSSGLGAGLGGGLGLVLGISDRRLKIDIEPVGKLNNGLPVYAFRYRGDPEMRIGLMADEVEKVHPRAVTELAGFKLVDYERAVR